MIILSIDIKIAQDKIDVSLLYYTSSFSQNCFFFPCALNIGNALIHLTNRVGTTIIIGVRMYILRYYLLT